MDPFLRSVLHRLPRVVNRIEIRRVRRTVGLDSTRKLNQQDGDFVSGCFTESLQFACICVVRLYFDPLQLKVSTIH